MNRQQRRAAARAASKRGIAVMPKVDDLDKARRRRQADTLLAPDDWATLIVDAGTDWAEQQADLEDGLRRDDSRALLVEHARLLADLLLDTDGPLAAFLFVSALDRSLLEKLKTSINARLTFLAEPRDR
jgi:hypothetical protein